MEADQTNQQIETQENERLSNSQADTQKIKNIQKYENNDQEYYKEIILKGHTQPVAGIKMEVIMEQMKKSLCKIYMNDKPEGSGFFCLIPFPDESTRLPVLFTNNHVLHEKDIENGKTIKFTLQNDKIKIEIIIDSKRMKYTSEILDTTIIEIKESDKIKINSFLEVDEKIFNSSKVEEDCKNEQIYIIQYPGGKECSYSDGKINRLYKHNIEHYCSTDKGSSGSPILNLFNFKVIGIHKKRTEYDYNEGTLIKIPIEEFIEKFKNMCIDEENIKNENIDLIKINNINEAKIERVGDEIIKNNINMYGNEKNEIVIKVKIGKKDISKEINYLGFNGAINYYKNNARSCSSEEEKEECYNLINNIEKQLSVLNEDNVILYINDKKEEFNKSLYFIPKVSGIYIIKLFFKNKLKCCVGMFFNCSSLIEINLSNFNTEKITDMQSMFQDCKNLKSLDLESFKTVNVTNINRMFLNCSSLLSLDLSSFNTENVSLMNRMFGNCYSLKSINLSSFNTKNVSNMYGMYEGCSSLLSLDLSLFNTQNVTNMSYMFGGNYGGCSSLTKLDLSSFNTENVSYMDWMFSNCSSLTILNLSSFNTKNVSSMESIFENCSSLTELDLSSFNTWKTMLIYPMFKGCSELKICKTSDEKIKYAFDNK